jgi:ribulose-5-phosphate 4-epimerase/fuculose-1-phosphate aldolase
MNIASMKEAVSEQEWELRVQLAACYRLVAMHGWTDLIFTHLSASVPGPQQHFLINPYGLMFDEITASSLVKVDKDCNKVIDSPFAVNPAGFVIHSCIHEARPDAVCVMHTHSRAGTAVSAQACGVLPISQHSMLVLDSLAYHDYEGPAVYPEEKVRLVADLGDKTYLVLRNHGLLTAAASIPEAFMAMFNFEATCRIQVDAQAGGTLVHIPKEILRGIGEAARRFGASAATELAWSALVRKLDRLDPSYRN